MAEPGETMELDQWIRAVVSCVGKRRSGNLGGVYRRYGRGHLYGG